MDKKLSDEKMSVIFGFKPAVGNCTARLMEVVIIKRKLEELAREWKKAHNQITDLRGKYQKDAHVISSAEASEDHTKIVRLEQDRTDAHTAWCNAYDIAKAADYDLGNNDVGYWAKPAATVA